MNVTFVLVHVFLYFYQLSQQKFVMVINFTLSFSLLEAQIDKFLLYIRVTALTYNGVVSLAALAPTHSILRQADRLLLSISTISYVDRIAEHNLLRYHFTIRRQFGWSFRQTLDHLRTT